MCHSIHSQSAIQSARYNAFNSWNDYTLNLVKKPKKTGSPRISISR